MRQPSQRLAPVALLLLGAFGAPCCVGGPACQAALRSLCGGSQVPLPLQHWQCTLCGGRNQRALKMANCTTADCASFCDSAGADNGTASFVPLELAEYPYARCLDGSRAGYYVRTATSAATADSWLFLLNGGGFCATREDCTARSTTDLGSSASWPLAFALNSTDLTTPDPRNPFASWNVVYLQYCDGSMHSGARTAPGAETFGLWFSGHHIIAAALDHLSQNAGLNATGSTATASRKVQVVFSGGSAGGVGVFSNVEYVAQSLPHAIVLGAPVGG
jgi:hypothetical protein